MGAAPAFETLRADAAGGAVGHLTLARPAKLNALSRRTLRELADAARWFDAQAQVVAVVVSGEGRAFSAGFDLDDFAAAGDEPPEAGADLGRCMAEAIGGMRAVTVAAIRGHCVGGGVVLAAACDLRVAAEGTRFSIPEVDLGIPLAWGGIPRLVREIGPARTKELVLTCRPFGAGEAHAFGFVNRVVPDGALAAEAEALATSIAAKAPLVVRTTKQQVDAAADELASTRGSTADALLLAAALHDPASRDAARRYLEARLKG